MGEINRKKNEKIIDNFDKMFKSAFLKKKFQRKLPALKNQLVLRKMISERNTFIKT